MFALKTVIFSLWLPILVVVVTFARFGFRLPEPGSGPDLQQFLLLFALAWPLAIPLTVAIGLLHRRSRIVAYICAVVLGAVSCFAVIVGGLLGPTGVLIYTIVASLPAWAALGILRMIQGRRA